MKYSFASACLLVSLTFAHVEHMLADTKGLDQVNCWNSFCCRDGFLADWNIDDDKTKIYSDGDGWAFHNYNEEDGAKLELSKDTL